MYYTTKTEILFFQFLFVGLKIVCTFAKLKHFCKSRSPFWVVERRKCFFIGMFDKLKAKNILSPECSMDG